MAENVKANVFSDMFSGNGRFILMVYLRSIKEWFKV